MGLKERVKRIEQDITPKKVWCKIWIGPPPKNYISRDVRSKDWTEKDRNEQYEQCIIFLPEKNPKPR